MDRMGLERWLCRPVIRQGRNFYISCPFHSEKTPSGCLFIKDQSFHCFGCKKSVTFSELSKFINVGPYPEASYSVDFNDKDNKPDIVVPENLVKTYIKNLELFPNLIDRLIVRVPSIHLIKEYKLGYDVSKGRFTIPIYDTDNICRDIKYIGIPNLQPKQLSYPDSKPQLFNFNRHKDSKIIILSAGEWDVLVMQNMEFPAICSTKGEGSFRDEWVELLKSKKIFILYDQDDAGYMARTKIAEMLYRTSTVLLTNFDIEIGKGGDSSDYYFKHNKRRNDFIKLFQSSYPYEGKHKSIFTFS